MSRATEKAVLKAALAHYRALMKVPGWKLYAPRSRLSRAVEKHLTATKRTKPQHGLHK